MVVQFLITPSCQDTQDKVLGSKSKATQDQRAQKYLGRMYEEIQKKVDAKKAAYEASLGNLPIPPLLSSKSDCDDFKSWEIQCIIHYMHFCSSDMPTQVPRR